MANLPERSHRLDDDMVNRIAVRMQDSGWLSTSGHLDTSCAYRSLGCRVRSGAEGIGPSPQLGVLYQRSVQGSPLVNECGKVVFSDPLENYYVTEYCNLPRHHKRPHRSAQGSSTYFSTSEFFLLMFGTLVILSLVGLAFVAVVALLAQ